MILTCPSCATRYFLNDVLVGRSGRAVKCTSCGSTWRAETEDDEPLPLQAPTPAQAELIEKSEPALKSEPEPLSGLPADRLSHAFRAKAQEQRKVREAAATGAIWAGLGAAIVLMVALAAVFRIDVVRLWPKTASAYAAVGLPVNTTGLIIEQVKAAPGADSGHPAVMVSGVMRNVIDRMVDAPPLKVSLLSKDGHSVERRTTPASDAMRIRPGETRHFTVSMIDPPKTAADVEVTFALDVMQPSAPVASGPSPKLRGPLVSPPPSAPKPTPAAAIGSAQDAKPLPATSPYALTSKTAS